MFMTFVLSLGLSSWNQEAQHFTASILQGKPITPQSIRMAQKKERNALLFRPISQFEQEGDREACLHLEIFLNPQARNTFLLLFERNTVAPGMNKPLQRKMLFSRGGKFFLQNSWKPET